MRFIIVFGGTAIVFCMGIAICVTPYFIDKPFYKMLIIMIFGWIICVKTAKNLDKLYMRRKINK